MTKQERRLTPQEQRRKERFLRLSEAMAAQGWRQRDLTVSILAANLWGLVLTLPLAVLAGFLYCQWNPLPVPAFSMAETLLLFPVLLVLIVLHEGIHGLTWGCFAPSRLRAIEFGVIWKALTPYCTCAEPLTKRQYLLGGLMPTLVLGFGLSAAAAALGSPCLFYLSAIMILSGGGDVLIAWKLLLHRAPDAEVRYLDHPYECGLVAFERPR